ncbi:MAG: hypothetical protein GY869_23280 [Planctomycetes bacterium]|nr:hypothetical protein [Planctomycetota bacterium]
MGNNAGFYLLVVLVLGLSGGAWGQVTWYVDDDGVGDLGPGYTFIGDPLEDGSFDHPFDAIQEGIDAAVDGDVVMVLDGVYRGVGNRDIDFRGKAITVSSEKGAENCIIDCQGTEIEPHRGFYFHNNERDDSVLDGLTITNGFQRKGGGISCNYSNPTIQNCIFTGNMASFGGGLYIRDSNLTLDNCMFSGNSTVNQGNNGGAGMYNSKSSPIVTKCTFTGNSTYDRGGGMYNNLSESTVISCTFTGNSAGRGGGMYNDESTPTVTNCIFWDNLALSEDSEIYNTSSSTPKISFCDIGGCLYGGF